jgi:exopolyphosphatase/guanosine-5'-triphosphate,3'-diphosphate pyrophosphatase
VPAPDPATPAATRPDGRIGVIDLGSNSIRLVVYDRPGRAPLPVFNEKVLCGLGRGLERTGRLNPDGVRLALENMGRFARIAAGMGLDRLDVLATAAARDAADGPEFVARMEAITGLPVTVLDGSEEARLSALGVVSGIPDADGAMGDLGGGSLEVVPIDRGLPGPEQVTLPLGPLRLMEHADGRSALVRHVDRQLDELGWLGRTEGRAFYPVGGSWRALAKAHMERAAHPVHVIHHYAVDADEMREFAELISRQSRSSLERAPGVSRRRADTLPLAALVMERVIRRARPARVVFSAYGLREGYQFDRLSEAERRQDPLLVACQDHARRIGRFEPSRALVNWTAPLFAGEDAAGERLRVAACMLSDLGWADHPDYRAEHAFLRALRMPYAGIDHPGRAFLALTVFCRYTGSSDDPLLKPALDIAGEAYRMRARVLGLALRLAHTMTGGVIPLLAQAPLRLVEDRLELTLTGEAADLAGDVVQRRLDALAAALDRRPAMVVEERRKAAE